MGTSKGSQPLPRWYAASRARRLPTRVKWEGWLLGAAVVAMAACSGGGIGTPQPQGCFVGDQAAAPMINLVHRTVEGTTTPVTDGDSLPLIVPPQGGEVLIVGVRALNIDGCPLTMATSLALTDGVVAAFERRPVTLQAAADGWLEPVNPAGLANFANLPACPIAGLDQAIDGESYRLTVEVEDRGGRRTQASATIVPTCDAAADPVKCHCLCAAHYVLGSPCP
jgi:hypothetical protein